MEILPRLFRCAIVRQLETARVRVKKETKMRIVPKAHLTGARFVSTLSPPLQAHWQTSPLSPTLPRLPLLDLLRGALFVRRRFIVSLFAFPAFFAVGVFLEVWSLLCFPFFLFPLLTFFSCHLLSVFASLETTRGFGAAVCSPFGTLTSQDNNGHKGLLLDLLLIYREESERASSSCKSDQLSRWCYSPITI